VTGADEAGTYEEVWIRRSGCDGKVTEDRRTEYRNGDENRNGFWRTMEIALSR
jgi:hypothetical protein